MLLATIAVTLAFQATYYEAGLRALDGRHYDVAIEDFKKAIADAPQDYAAHFNLAFAYSMTGKDADAVAEYERALALKPDLYQAQLNLGILLLRDKQPAAAVSHLEAAAAAKAKEYRPNYYLAEALRETGADAKAEDAYRAALAIDPKSAAAELGLAQSLLAEGKTDDAAPHFHKAAELDPRYRDGLLALAERYEKNKQTDEAIAIYRQFPDDAGAQERLGELLYEAGRFEEAIPFFENAVNRSPTAANQIALAQAYARNKEPGKAQPIVARVLASDPNNYDLRMLYGRMLRDAHKINEAAQQFMQAAQLKPDSAQAWTELADMLVLLENYSGALSALDRVAALHAEKPGHVYLRAIVLDKVHQLKPALAAYRRFLEMDGGKDPDEDFKARQRVRIIEGELGRR